MSVRDKIEDEENKRTLRALISERSARRRAELQEAEKGRLKEVRDLRIKKLGEVRDKREAAEKRQRLERMAKAQGLVDGNLQVAYRAMRVALAAAESVRVNKYTEEGRQQRERIKSLRVALDAVRQAGGRSTLSDPDLNSDT